MAKLKGFRTGMSARFVLGAAAILLLLGCDSSSTSSDSSGSATSPVTGFAEGVTFEVVPGTLRECDPPADVVMNWNALAAGVNAVKIYTIGGDGQETLFAFYGPEGSKVAGPPTKANDTFIVKDEGDTRQLAKFVVGTEKCE